MSKEWSLFLTPNKMSAELLVGTDAMVEAEELTQALVSAGICYGLDRNAVDHALAYRGEKITVAHGLDPVPGQDAELVFHVSEDYFFEKGTTTIGKDLRQQVSILAVESGQLLAEVIPPQPGTPGTNIHGENIPPSKPRETILRALKGTELMDDGRKIVSTITGRPRLDLKKGFASFQVLPNYVHRGDITVKIGYLSFQGDIAIMGNVTEGTAVTATGSIDVSGNVIGAEITACQNVKITGNVIQSNISGGMESLFASMTLPLLEEIVNALTDLNSVFLQLSSHKTLGALPFNRLAQHVVSSRFPEWENYGIKLMALVTDKNYSPNPSARETLRLTAESLSFISWQDYSQFTTLITHVNELKTTMEEAAFGGGDVNLTYALNSKIKAGNAIVIKGQGCFHSTLDAGRTVKVLGKVRGGSVNAPENIYIIEVGSDAGVVTTLQVSGSGVIMTDKSFENTIYIVGKNILRTSDLNNRVRTFINQDAHLTLIPRR